MSEEYVRILICHTCKSIEELPDYEGDPARDDTLNYRVSSHRFPDGNEHFGSLGRVKKTDWNKKTYRDGILAELDKAIAPGMGEGLGNTFYDVKNNFQQDAMACWKQHNRTMNCDDYRSDRKRLYPDTKGDRKLEGVSTSKRDMPNTWLCDFCPVQSVATTAMRKKRGDYN